MGNMMRMMTSRQEVPRVTGSTTGQDHEDIVMLVPFQDGRKYNIWALASNTGNGFLKPDGDRLTASGKADTNDATECEWIAKEVPRPQAIYWKLLTNDETKEIVADSQQGIRVVAVHTVTDDSNLFLPASVRSVALYGTLQPKETSADVFLGANGDGTMVLITNNNINKRSNPHPQTLLMPFHVRT